MTMANSARLPTHQKLIETIERKPASEIEGIDDEPPCCPVCREDYATSDEDAVILPCCYQHIGLNCLDQWLSESFIDCFHSHNKCPLCRRELCAAERPTVTAPPVGLWTLPAPALATDDWPSLTRGAYDGPLPLDFAERLNIFRNVLSGVGLPVPEDLSVLDFATFFFTMHSLPAVPNWSTMAPGERAAAFMRVMREHMERGAASQLPAEVRRHLVTMYSTFVLELLARAQVDDPAGPAVALLTPNAMVMPNDRRVPDFDGLMTQLWASPDWSTVQDLVCDSSAAPFDALPAFEQVTAIATAVFRRRQGRFFYEEFRAPATTLPLLVEASYWSDDFATRFAAPLTGITIGYASLPSPELHSPGEFGGAIPKQSSQRRRRFGWRRLFR